MAGERAVPVSWVVTPLVSRLVSPLSSRHRGEVHRRLRRPPRGVQSCRSASPAALSPSAASRRARQVVARSPDAGRLKLLVVNVGSWAVVRAGAGDAGADRTVLAIADRGAGSAAHALDFILPSPPSPIMSTVAAIHLSNWSHRIFPMRRSIVEAARSRARLMPSSVRPSFASPAFDSR